MGGWWDDTAGVGSGERSMGDADEAQPRAVGRFGRRFLLQSTKVNRTESNDPQNDLVREPWMWPRFGLRASCGDLCRERR